MAEQHTRQGAVPPPPAGSEMDAVCEQCGTVNPEETLLCKNCGNNLREQRARRLAESRATEKLQPINPPTRWLSGLLTVFGLLLIVWTAINVDRIEEWLTQTQSSAETEASSLADGTYAATFEEMLSGIDQHPATQNEINRALAQRANPEIIPGRYIVMLKGAARPAMVAQAEVREEGKGYLFAAKTRFGAEVRGVAHIEKNGILQAPEIALRMEDSAVTASGFAQSSEGTGFDLYGVSPSSEGSFEAVAYAIPSGEQL